MFGKKGDQEFIHIMNTGSVVYRQFEGDAADLREYKNLKPEDKTTIAGYIALFAHKKVTNNINSYLLWKGGTSAFNDNEEYIPKAKFTELAGLMRGELYKLDFFKEKFFNENITVLKTILNCK